MEMVTISITDLMALYPGPFS